MREGKDVSIVAHSIGVGFAVAAAEELAKEGISCEVINLRSIRPLDMNTINTSIMKTHHCITVEGGWPQHGVGAEISASISEGPAFHYLDAPVIRICGVDTPMPYAKACEDAATPQPHNIVAAVKRMLGRK
jgi:pyruvate dehydrogenase E1 component beta subunit